MSPTYRKRNCLDCDALVTFYAQRCKSCAAKVRNQPKKNPIPYHRRPEGRAALSMERKRLQERRRLWYFGFMANRCCEDCGATNQHSRLEWHHRDPATKFLPVSRMIANFNTERVLAEIAKCDLLCKACHLARHRAMRTI